MEADKQITEIEPEVVEEVKPVEEEKKEESEPVVEEEKKEEEKPVEEEKKEEEKPIEEEKKEEEKPIEEEKKEEEKPIEEEKKEEEKPVEEEKKEEENPIEEEKKEEEKPSEEEKKEEENPFHLAEIVDTPVGRGVVIGLQELKCTVKVPIKGEKPEDRRTAVCNFDAEQLKAVTMPKPIPGEFRVLQANVFIDLAEYLTKAGKINESVYMLTTSIEHIDYQNLEPELKQTGMQLVLICLLTLSKIYMTNNSFEEALNCANNVCTIDPTNYLGAVYKCSALISLNRPMEALNYATELQKVYPENENFAKLVKNISNVIAQMTKEGAFGETPAEKTAEPKQAPKSAFGNIFEQKKPVEQVKEETKVPEEPSSNGTSIYIALGVGLVAAALFFFRRYRSH
ncbi:hypothetical protein WA158_005171 [Blastocystis sp. Blastoise]